MENKNTQILKEIETNTEMGLVQSEKIANAVDGLEPVMEGILLKTNELVEETKNVKPQQIVINVEGDVETIKGEKGDTPEVDYDAIGAKLEEMHKESMGVMHKELVGKVREDTLTIAEAIKPELLHEVEEKMTEFGQVLLVDVKNVEDKVTQTESQIDVTDSNLKKLEKRVDDIKIPTYDLSPYAMTEEVAKEVSDVKKTIDDKVAETAKSIETLKGEVEKKVSDLEDEQMQRLQKVASKTVSLVELDDVNLDGLTQTNGKYDLGSGGGSGGSSVVVSARRTGGSISLLLSQTTIIFDTEDVDTNSAYDVSTGTFTTPTTGNYLISAQITIGVSGSDAGDEFFLYISNNGTDIATTSGVVTFGTALQNRLVLTLSRIVPLTESSSIYIAAKRTGAAANVEAFSGVHTILSITSL